MNDSTSDISPKDKLESAPTSLLRIVRKIKASSFESKLLLALVLIGIVIFTTYQLKLTKPTEVTTPMAENKNLVVLGIAPTDYTPGLPNNITISFSDPVTIHSIADSFEIVPTTDGSFTSSLDKKTITFKPKKSFLENTSYGVKIKSGLMSTNGKTLLDNYTNTFITQIKIDEIQFVKDEIKGKVLNYASGDVSFVVKTGALGSNAKALLYEANEQDLLSYLTFERIVKDEGRYEYAQELYKNKFTFDFANRRLIKSLNMEDSETTITLPLKSGIYYIEGQEKQTSNIEGSSFIVVNDTGVVMRQDDKSVLLSSFDLATSTATNDPISLSFYSLEQNPKKIADHILQGTGSFNNSFDKRVDLIIGKKGAETIIVPVKVPQSLADIRVRADLNKYIKLFLYTDRPIYKPGDKIAFRGVARIDSDALYKIPTQGQKIHIFLGSIEKPLFETDVYTNEHGVFYGEFIAPKIESGSQYENTQFLYALPDYNNKSNYDQSASAYFDIVEYKKPNFELQTQVSKEEILQNETLTFTITGSYFNSAPLKNEDVSYKLYSQNFYETEKAVYNSSFKLSAQGGMCGGGFGIGDEWYGEELPQKGDIKLDAQGRKTITFKPNRRQDLLSQEITFVAEKKDTNGNLIVSAISSIVHAGDFNIFYPPSTQNYSSGDVVKIPFYAEYSSGAPVAQTKFDYKLLGFELVPGQDSREKAVLSGAINTDSSGKATVELTMPKVGGESNYFYFSVTSKDNAGNIVEARKSLYLVEKEKKQSYYRDFWDTDTQTYLKVVSSNNSYKVGETISLSVESPKQIDALLTLERGRIYKPQVVHLKKGSNTIQIPVEPDLSPSATVVFSYFADKAYFTEGMSINIPAMHKLLAVDISVNKNKFIPSENAILKINTKNAQGQPVQAQVSIGVVDKAIYALRKNATPVFHSTYYAFRSRTTNASSSLTPVGTFDYGGRGGGGGGGLSPVSPIDTLYWNPNITTDQNGQAIIEIPLKNVETTWNVLVLAATDSTDVGQSDINFVVSK